MLSKHEGSLNKEFLLCCKKKVRLNISRIILTQHDCHHDTKVKPEAATAVTELLIMGGKTPKTCWAVNKRQDNKMLHQVGDLFELYDDARTYKP